LQRSGKSAKLTLALHTLPRRRQCELMHVGDIAKENIFHISSPTETAAPNCSIPCKVNLKMSSYCLRNDV